MKEIIFIQRKEDNNIKLFKNYSNIKNHNFNQKLYLNDKPIKGRKVFYFYDYNKPQSKDSMDDIFGNSSHISLEQVKNKTFRLNKDIQIKRNYNNPFAILNLNIWERKITKKDDNLTISIYSLYRNKDLNCRIFSRTVGNVVISFNIKTGNFTTIRDFSKTKKIIRKNSFSELETVFYYFNKFNDFENEIFFNEICRLFNDNFETTKQYDFEDVKESLISFFIKQKRIKTPNDYIFLLKQCYPTELFLKKNDRKLVMSILDKYNIKSNITNKIFHQYPKINLKPFAAFLHLLGKDFNKYVGNLNIKNFSYKKKYENNHFDIPSTTYTLTKKDKENLVKIVNSLDNDVLYDKYDHNMHTHIVDHINMLATLREYDLNYNINATTYDAFQIEHSEFGKLHSLIKKGYEIEYVFSEKTINEIEEPINVKIELNDKVVYETFYPVLLKKENEYKEEGKIMHHCVGSYVNKVKSVIISIRTIDNTDRITCEFDTATGRCIQAKHIQNAQPPGDFILALDVLKKKTARLASYGLLHSTETKTIPLVINGIEVKKDKVVPHLQDDLAF